MTSAYSIYINDKYITTVEGNEAAYVCYKAAKVIAETTGKTAYLVQDDSGEIIANSDEEEEQ